MYTTTLPALYDYAGGTVDGAPFSSIDFGAFRKVGAAWVFTHESISLSAPQRFRGMLGGAPGDGQVGGDTNFINCFFWNIAIRSIGGTRKVYAIHDVRPNSDTDTDGIIQYYVITPNDYPTGTPTKTVSRFNPQYGWAYDSSISANCCGDIAIGFTLAWRDSNNVGIYPEFWRWLVPSGGGATKVRVQAGPNQYREGSPWADFNQVAADPSDPTQFFAHHILVHDDGVGPSSTQWDGWLALFTIPDCGCQRRPGDDGGGGPDLFALLDFLNAANGDEPAADLNEDGEVTVLDYLIAFEGYASGG